MCDDGLQMQHPCKINTRLREKAINGITLIELLLAIASLSLLLLLVWPSLLGAREGSRNAHCKQNLRKIGQALHGYHKSNKKLPPAAIWGWDMANYDIDTGAVDANWVVFLLPHLDRHLLHNSFSWEHPISARENSNFRNTLLAELSCPADEYNRKGNKYIRNYEPGKHAYPRTYARGNYAINGGSHARCDAPGHSGEPCPSGFQEKNRGVSMRSDETYRRWGTGIAGINKTFSLDDFTNGLSKTVAIDEIRSGIHPLDSRGVWSGGHVGMSITWAHGIHGDAVGPNNPTPDSDDIHGCNLLYEVVGLDELVKQKMGCCGHCLSGNDQAGARSMHPDGVHVLMCDESVSFVKDDIDVSIWHVMHSKDTQMEFTLPFK